MRLDKQATRQALAEFMLRNPKYEGISSGEIQTLVGLATFRKYKKGSFVYMEEEPAGFFCLILSGSVEINKVTSYVQEKVFCILYPGDDFGFPEMFEKSGLFNTNARCLEDSVIGLVGKKDLTFIISHLPGISAKYLKIICGLICSLQREMIITDAEKRLLTFLRFLIEKQNQETDLDVVLKKKISIERLAKLLNMTRETLSRVLTDLDERRIIEKTSGYITVRDLDAVENETQGLKTYWIYGSEKYI